MQVSLQPVFRGTRRPQLSAVLNRSSQQANGLIALWPLLGADAHVTELIGGYVPPIPTDFAFLNTGITEDGLSMESTATGNKDLYSFNATNVQSRWWPNATDTEATASAWVKLRVATPTIDTATAFPFSFDGDANTTNAIAAYPYSNGLIYSSMFISSRVNSITPLASVDRAQWHLLTVTRKAGTNGWTLYQNAQIVTQATPPSAQVSVNVQCRIGQSIEPGFNYNFNGWMKDLRLYRRCLSDAEVWALYDPVTRWELYRRPYPAATFISSPAPAGAIVFNAMIG